MLLWYYQILKNYEKKIGIFPNMFFLIYVMIIVTKISTVILHFRSRSEYLNLLQHDLCTYYSYNNFLLEKLMQMFPLDELLEFLEASEVQRPMTIRTNTLKTRRRDLAEVSS